MIYRKFSLIILLLLPAFFYSCSRSVIRSGKRPNIVLILADDMGFSDISYFGSEIPTPNIDKLADGGLVMTHFYNASRCTPTRASLLTGLYQTEAGFGAMTANLGYSSGGYQGYLNDRCVTLAEALKRGGYATIMTGKWHLGNPEKSWPQNRGFEKFFGVPKGGGIYFWPFLLDRTVMLNNRVYQPDSSFYSTIAFTDYSVKFLNDVKKSSQPFFLYVAYMAPHYPLQAPDSVIGKYRGKYREGFAKIRQRRFERMKKRGIIPENTELSPPDKRVEDWNQLSAAEKDSMDKRMAVYAAQIDIMDQGIGRIINKLKEMNVYDNTVVIFLSDNGGCSEYHLKPRPGAHGPTNGAIGSRNFWGAYGPSWANVSNTPFRMYKKWEEEGGIATPFIVHWPDKIKKHRLDTLQVGHVIDIMPTLLDIAGIDYPHRYNGHDILPMEGKSLLPVINGNELKGERTVFWEHEGNRAIRQGSWKLVSMYPENQWRLFNLKSDITELHDVSSEHSSLVREMIGKYQHWANRVGVLPWGSARDHK